MICFLQEDGAFYQLYPFSAPISGQSLLSRCRSWQQRSVKCPECFGLYTSLSRRYNTDLNQSLQLVSKQCYVRLLLSSINFIVSSTGVQTNNYCAMLSLSSIRSKSHTYDKGVESSRTLVINFLKAENATLRIRFCWAFNRRHKYVKVSTKFFHGQWERCV